jgi:hypothetical protein
VEQAGLVGEADIDRAFGGPDLAGDLLDRGGAIALAQKQRLRRDQDLLAEVGGNHGARPARFSGEIAADDRLPMRLF